MSLLHPIPQAPMAEGDARSSPSAFAEIVLVRHGETVWNAEKRLQGQHDVELNEKGLKQAESVAKYLSKDSNFSCIYSSDLKRAVDTAKTIAAACGNLNVVTDSDLRERNLGRLEGLLLKDAASVDPVAYSAFRSKNIHEKIPGSEESLYQLFNRCTGALQRIAKNHIGQKVVVVAHGGVIRAAHKRASLFDQAGKVSNASVSVFHISEDQWIIKRWNDVSHLSCIGCDPSGFGGEQTSG